jgi:hypothetical protein
VDNILYGAFLGEMRRYRGKEGEYFWYPVPYCDRQLTDGTIVPRIPWSPRQTEEACMRDWDAWLQHKAQPDIPSPYASFTEKLVRSKKRK